MCDYPDGFTIETELNNFDGYVLAITNDTPYHEGVEFWFNNNLEELIHIAHSEWDWLNGRSDILLYRFKYGQLTETIDNILPVDEEDDEWGLVDKEKYPPIETDSGYVNIYICDSCSIFEKETGKCSLCGQRTRSTGSELYS